LCASKTIHHNPEDRDVPKRKRYTKAGNQNSELSIVCIFKETKAKFLFHKNFCDPFVPFVVFSSDWVK